MSEQQLADYIKQERANETNAAIQLGVAMGRRAAFEDMLAELRMQIAVDKAKQEAGKDEAKA